MNHIPATLLSESFTRRWLLNSRGGYPARLARWKSQHWLLLQRLGLHRWVRAHLFWGERMWVLTGEGISRGLLSFGYAEAALTAVMLRGIYPGMRVMDIGAHLGYEAILASVLAGSKGKVVSFEPQPQVVTWTARNLAPFANTRLVSAAVGDFNGTVLFNELDILNSAFSGLATSEPNQPQIRVPMTTLSQALRHDERPVDFIKCDVEGNELAVLRGAKDILAHDRPLLVLEAGMLSASDTEPRVAAFDKFLSDFGYVGFSFEFDGTLRTAPLGKLQVGHANVGFIHPSRGEFTVLRHR